MFCSNCGVKLLQDASFCGQCGAVVIVEQSRLVSSGLQQVRCTERKEIDTLSLVLSIVGLAGTLMIAIAVPITLGCSIAGLVIARRRREANNVSVATAISIIGIVIATMVILLIGGAILLSLSSRPYIQY